MWEPQATGSKPSQLPADLTSRLDARLLRAVQYLNLSDSLLAYLQNRDQALFTYLSQCIHLASLQVSAMAAALDCEEEVADQLAGILQKQTDKRETRLTAAAISIGATGALGSALLLGNGNWPEIVGISTAITEVGLAALLFRNKQITWFEHEVNYLIELKSGRQSPSLYPDAVWEYLNATDSSGQSRIDYLLNGWDLSDEALYFGSGAFYNADQLRYRAEMHDQLEAQLSLMKQELMLLLEAILFNQWQND